MSTTASPMSRRLILLLFVSLTFLASAIGWRFLAGSEIAQAGDSSTPRRSDPIPSTQTTIERVQARLQARPSADDFALLGMLFLQRARENGDAALYVQAQTAFDAALARDPNHVDALIGYGMLSNTRHDFAAALAWAERAHALNPLRADILGVKVDALVELGRYPAAVEALQAMVDQRPDLNSYSRVSYLRELHGDADGAIAAMRAAMNAGAPGSEPWLWATAHLGNLFFNRGDLDTAESVYRQALALKPDYVFAQAGQAKVWAARGDTQRATTTYEGIIARLPLPEFAVALGELYEAEGQVAQANAQYDLVRTVQQLNAAAGMNVDMEMALFNADHGDDAAAAVVQARAAYAVRPTIYAAYVLAWALYRAGNYDEAWKFSIEARRLGTKDALLDYHAGMIALARGDDTGARQHLEAALAQNPYFSPLRVQEAKAALARLAAQ